MKSNFDDLAKALQNGDLDAARAAFDKIQSARSNNATSTTRASTTNSMSSAMQALANALNAGDLSAAQKAFASIAQSMQTRRHHHHHHDRTAQSGQTADQTSTNPLFGALAGQLNISA
ncbi:MAG TPA: hypothetical protein VNI20_11850 [Fimbriimonadaceae bacterium]|nr:hypothetical protein [Fimbriimonadaceae bacterium]